jgi:hypothetical protein
MSVGAIPATDRRSTTRPGNLFRSVTQPAPLRRALARSRGLLVRDLYDEASTAIVDKRSYIFVTAREVVYLEIEGVLIIRAVDRHGSCRGPSCVGCGGVSYG